MCTLTTSTLYLNLYLHATTENMMKLTRAMNVHDHSVTDCPTTVYSTVEISIHVWKLFNQSNKSSRSIANDTISIPFIECGD